MLTIDAIENFKFHCKYEKNLNPKTLRAYDIDINQFLESFFFYKIKEISKLELMIVYLQLIIIYLDLLKSKQQNNKII